MGDSLKKVHTGQPLKIPAATFNAFINAAKAHQQQQQIGQAGQASSRGHLVLVRNNSAATVDRFGVLAITGTVFAPTNDEFMNRIIFEGNTPSADLLGSFVITAEPIKASGIGAAFAAGVCPVQIDVTDDDHRQADTASGDAAKLKSGYGGAAAILWREGGLGVQWSVIRFGKPPGGSGIMRAKATAAAVASTTIAAVLLTAAGEAGTAISVTSLDGSNWSDLFPLLAINDVFAVVQINSVWYGVGFAYVGACA